MEPKKPIRIVTGTELDPFTAAAINYRFVNFLILLARALDVPFHELAAKAREILQDAEISQE